MNAVRDVDDSILEQARSLLPYIRSGGHHGTRLTTLGDIPEMFVHLFEFISMETIQEGKKPFGSKRDQAATLQTILDTLEQHLQLPLSHVSGWGLVTLDRRQMADALQIFTDLVTELASLGQSKVPLRETGQHETADNMFTPPIHISKRTLPDDPLFAQREAMANERYGVRQLNFTDESTDGATSYTSLRRADLDEQQPNTGRRPDPDDACRLSTSTTTHAKQPFANTNDVTTSSKGGPYRLHENNSSGGHLGVQSSVGESYQGNVGSTQLGLHAMMHKPYRNRSLREKEYSTSALPNLNENVKTATRQEASANGNLRAEGKTKHKKDKTQLREKLEPYKKPTEVSVKLKFNLKDRLPSVNEPAEKVCSDFARFCPSMPVLKRRHNSVNKCRSGAKLRDSQTYVPPIVQRHKPFVVGTVPSYQNVKQAAKVKIRNPSVKIRKPSVKTFSPVKRVFSNSTARNRNSSYASQRTWTTASVNKPMVAENSKPSQMSHENSHPKSRRPSVVSTKVRKSSNGSSNKANVTGKPMAHSDVRTHTPNYDGRRRNTSDKSKSTTFENKHKQNHNERGPPSPQTTSLCASLKLLEEFDYVKRRLKQIRTQRRELLQCVRELDAEKIRLEHVMSHVRENAALSVTEAES